MLGVDTRRHGRKCLPPKEYCAARLHYLHGHFDAHTGPISPPDSSNDSPAPWVSVPFLTLTTGRLCCDTACRGRQWRQAKNNMLPSLAKSHFLRTEADLVDFIPFFSHSLGLSVSHFVLPTDCRGRCRISKRYGSKMKISRVGQSQSHKSQGFKGGLFGPTWCRVFQHHLGARMSMDAPEGRSRKGLLRGSGLGMVGSAYLGADADGHKCRRRRRERTGRAETSVGEEGESVSEVGLVMRPSTRRRISKLEETSSPASMSPTESSPTESSMQTSVDPSSSDSHDSPSASVIAAHMEQVEIEYYAKITIASVLVTGLVVWFTCSFWLNTSKQQVRRRSKQEGPRKILLRGRSSADSSLSPGNWDDRFRVQREISGDATGGAHPFEQHYPPDKEDQLYQRHQEGRSKGIDDAVQFYNPMWARASGSSSEDANREGDLRGRPTPQYRGDEQAPMPMHPAG